MFSGHWLFKDYQLFFLFPVNVEIYHKMTVCLICSKKESTMQVRIKRASRMRQSPQDWSRATMLFNLVLEYLVRKMIALDTVQL